MSTNESFQPKVQAITAVASLFCRVAKHKTKMITVFCRSICIEQNPLLAVLPWKQAKFVVLHPICVTCKIFWPQQCMLDVIQNGSSHRPWARRTGRTRISNTSKLKCNVCSSQFSTKFPLSTILVGNNSLNNSAH